MSGVCVWFVRFLSQPPRLITLTLGEMDGWVDG